MGAISTGLMAALGINTFFSGDSADSLAVNSQVHSNTNLIASGQVNGQHQANADNTPQHTAIGFGRQKNYHFHPLEDGG